MTKPLTFAQLVKMCHYQTVDMMREARMRLPCYCGNPKCILNHPPTNYDLCYCGDPRCVYSKRKANKA